MSWESYSQRASGTNVQRILSEMTEAQRRKEELRQREEQVRQQRAYETQAAQAEAHQRYLAELIRGNPAHAQDIIRSNPGAFAGINYDTTQFQPTPEEQFQSEVLNKKREVFKTLPMSANEAGTYHSAYGGAMPSDLVQSRIANDVYAHPQDFDPQMQPRQRIADKIEPTGNEAIDNVLNREKFEKAELPKSRAEVGKIVAEAGESGAKTRKIGEETITERESRDPNSPTSKAKGASAGRKGFSEKMVDAFDKELESLRAQKNSIESKIIDPSKTLDKAAAAARLTAISKAIEAKTSQRNALMSGGGEAYAPGRRNDLPKGVPSAQPTQTQNGPKPVSAEVERGIKAVQAVHPELTRDQIIELIRKQAGNR